MLKFRLPFSNSEKGQMSLVVLIFSTVAVVIIAGLIVWIDSNQKVTIRDMDQKLALAIAESGIEYYRWHLAHDSEDFQDGTGQEGPYTHPYLDKNGNQIGQFILDIIPPPANSSLVTITATGKVDADPSIQKKIKAKLGIPSYIRYAVLANSDIQFDSGAETFGPIHSNGGIRFDGVAHNLVTSSRSTYNDPSHSGSVEYGVHTHTAPVDPIPPEPLPVRQDIFMAGRQFPVPLVDFVGLTDSLADIKSKAQDDGLFFNKGPKKTKGYHIVLKTNDTFDLYQVKKFTKKPDKSCKAKKPPGGKKNKKKGKWAKWNTWGIKDETFLGNYPFPDNGLIFLENHVWVDGQIDSAKITIASGVLPANSKKYTNIIVNNDLTYTNYNGSDVIGLIAQGDFNIGMDSEDDLRIDAAIVAQNGRAGRHYYKPPGSKPGCSPYHERNSLILNGMIATNFGYGFAYTDGSGYQSRTIIYDSNLLFNPPPGFPSVSGFYEQVSWDEIQ
jgi:hypothetical protein